MAKDLKTGEEVPWDPDPDAKWIDGSVDNDLPMTRLAELFNINHFIVSQVNPHVVPFLEKEEELATIQANGTASPAGPDWMSSMASLAKGEVLHRLHVVAEMGIFPTYATKLRGLLSQRYSGDINIFPAISYTDFPRVLSNPTTEYMLGCLLTGQRATWPKLSRIQNHVAIELALDNLIHKVKARTVFSSAQAQSLTLSRPSSQGYESSSVPRTRPNSKALRFALKTEPSSPVLLKRDPFSPLLTRSTPRLPTHESRSSSRNQTLEVPFPSGNRTSDNISTSTNPDDSSDKDYYAEIDSDTSELLSSPSLITSPSSHGPTVWPPTRHTSLLTVSAPTTPAISTSSDRHIGTLLNLTMTPASNNPPAPTPSSPELRYKRIFHPPGPVAPEVNVKPPTPTHMESLSSVTPSTPNRSPAHSRRGSSAGLVLDISGARGMLRRKKSVVNFQQSYFE